MANRPQHMPTHAPGIARAQFACGSAFQKGKNGLPDQIEIQGNYIEELPGFINEKYKIDLKDISLVEGGKKTKASEAAAVDN